MFCNDEETNMPWGGCNVIEGEIAEFDVVSGIKGLRAVHVRGAARNSRLESEVSIASIEIRT